MILQIVEILTSPFTRPFRKLAYAIRMRGYGDRSESEIRAGWEQAMGYVDGVSDDRWEAKKREWIAGANGEDFDFENDPYYMARAGEHLQLVD